MCSCQVFFFFMISNHKMIHVPFFRRLFTQHRQWIINFTFLSCLDAASSHASVCKKKTSIFCRRTQSDICLVLCTKQFANILVMWPPKTGRPKVFCPTISPRVENRSLSRMMNLGCIHHLWELMSHFLTFDYQQYREQDKLNCIWI